MIESSLASRVGLASLDESNHLVHFLGGGSPRFASSSSCRQTAATVIGSLVRPIRAPSRPVVSSSAGLAALLPLSTSSAVLLEAVKPPAVCPALRVSSAYDLARNLDLCSSDARTLVDLTTAESRASVE